METTTTITATTATATEITSRVRTRVRLYTALAGAALLIGVTGHFGGTLVFGIDYYRW